jgi:hypothetical protein
MRRGFRPISLHAVVPILLGGLLAATGHSQILWRSIVLVVCAVWVSLDIGIWLSQQSWVAGWKSIIFSITLSLLCTASMVGMWNFMSSVLADQRDEVWDKLDANAYTPKSGDIFMSTFTVTNGGDSAIGRNHQLSCAVNLIAFAHHGRMSGGGALTVQTIPFEILPGGDSQTDSCFQGGPGTTLIYGLPTQCADVTLVIDYALSNQPLARQRKAWRFVASEDDDFVWHGQALTRQVSPCQAYVDRD